MRPEAASGDPRKIERRYTEGDLVRVAGGRNQAEADLIAGLLLEEGIPSLVRRSPAADVPERKPARDHRRTSFRSAATVATAGRAADTAMSMSSTYCPQRVATSASSSGRYSVRQCSSR